MRDFRTDCLKLLPAAVLLCAAPTPAEVGASGPPGMTPVVVHVVSEIVDDPEPIGNAWQRYQTDTPQRKILNDAGYANGDGAPSVVRDSTGTPLVAWSRNSPGGFDIVLSRFVNGDWTSPVVVAGTDDDEKDATIVLHPVDGSVHLLYWIDDGSPRVMHQQAPADLSSWSTAVQVSQLGEAACRPSAVFHEGGLRIAYEVHEFGYGSTPRQIVMATQQGPGYTSELVAVTQYAGANHPVAHCGNGKLWVDWIDAEGEMAWTRHLAAGGWEPIALQAFETTEERDYHTRGAIRSQAIE